MFELNTDLKPLFSYNIIIVINTVIVLFLLIIFKFIYDIFLKNLKFKKFIKKKYIKKLDKLEKNFQYNKVEIRDAYIVLSSIIRNFVYEITGIKVQNYTLSDIKNMNISHLEDLINEYYKHEFEKNSNGNIEESIEKTKKIVKEWK